jgi:hypothetical protein
VPCSFRRLPRSLTRTAHPHSGDPPVTGNPQGEDWGPSFGFPFLARFAFAENANYFIRPSSLGVELLCRVGWGCAMKRTEAEFCREQAERLLKLAKECTDFKVRKHLTDMAQEWVERAKVKSAKEPA